MDVELRLLDMATAADGGQAILKGSKIWVVVEEALVDVIVVSFTSGDKTFQGALLDITKKNCSFGVIPRPEDPFGQSAVLDVSVENELEENRYPTLSQRYTYFQPRLGEPAPNQKRTVPRQRDQNVRMRRLRPRQVLCSHCQTLCNESVSVQSGSISSSTNKPKYMSTRNRVNNSDRNVVNNNNIEIKQDVNNSDVRPGNAPSLNEASEPKVAEEATDDHTKQCDPVEACHAGNGEYQAVSSSELTSRMVLRKRKLPNHVGDYVELTKQRKTEVLTDNNTSNDTLKSQMTCPVIKISYANPQGKDTVLKIPARLPTGNEEQFVWCDQLDNKAAKKALKKAKKEAHRKSWCELIDNGDNLEKNKHHHHHHKHKLKRKRKRKEFLDKDDNYDSENVYSEKLRTELGLLEGQPGWSLCSTDNSEDLKEKDFLDDVKKKCLKQKLSISLRRLSAKAYKRCSPKYGNKDSNGSTSSGSDSECDVPDFPKHEPLRDMDKVKPLMMRLSTHNVKKCLLDNEREMAVGDVVWGKIQGFPWWPGKILALSVSQRDNGATLNHQAHVAWFGSSTSSYMSCNQLTPFLDDFKLRYNKRKRGPYKEAIKQATIEAQSDLLDDIICDEGIS